MNSKLSDYRFACYQTGQRRILSHLFLDSDRLDRIITHNHATLITKIHLIWITFKILRIFVRVKSIPKKNQALVSHSFERHDFLTFRIWQFKCLVVKNGLRSNNLHDYIHVFSLITSHLGTRIERRYHDPRQSRGKSSRQDDAVRITSHNASDSVASQSSAQLLMWESTTRNMGTIHHL